MPLPETLQKLTPGDAILLDDITQMPAFEDMVAEQVDPTMTPAMRDAWAGRVVIRDLLRPPRFNGSLTDIKLVVMEAPLDRLFDARERGWTFSRHIGSGYPINRPHDDEITGSYQGFELMANAHSTGRGVVGQVQAEIWYGRVPTYRTSELRTLKDGSVSLYHYDNKQAANHGGMSVQRYITSPKLETGVFINLDENARRIGFQVLSHQMRHPIIEPVRN
jgi:hypothetical protein